MMNNAILIYVRKMIIKSIKLSITPQREFYYVTNGTLRIYVGINTGTTNFINDYVNRSWTFVKLDGSSPIIHGTVSVKLNSFTSYVDLTVGMGLFVFTIDDNLAYVNTSQPISIDQNYELTSSFTAIGNLDITWIGMKLYPKFKGTTFDEARKGGMLIMNNQVYVYVPTFIRTTSIDLPSTFTYRPLPFMNTVTVPVQIIPRVARTAYHTYSITPATRVVLDDGVTSVDTMIPVTTASLISDNRVMISAKY